MHIFILAQKTGRNLEWGNYQSVDVEKQYGIKQD